MQKYIKRGRKIYTRKSIIGDEDFDKEFWEKVSVEEKFSAAWQLMIDAMIIKGKPEKLKMRKIIKIKRMDGKILKEINLEDENSNK